MHATERASFVRLRTAEPGGAHALQPQAECAPLPRSVEAAAQGTFRLMPLNEEELQTLQRYYDAGEVTIYRPTSLEFFFRPLPDILQHAIKWCNAVNRA